METLEKIHTGVNKSHVFVSELIDFLSSSVDVEQQSKLLDATKKQKLTKDDVLSSYVVIFDQIEQMKKIIDDLSNLVLDPDQHSGTFRAEVKTQVAKVSSKFGAFLRDVDEMSDKLVVDMSNQLVSQIKASEDKLKAIDDLRSKYHKHGCLIKIYTSVLQRCLDELDRNIAFKLLDYIAEDKDRVFQNVFPKSKEKPAKNPPATRYGLTPATKCMPLEELIPIVFGGEKVSGKDLKKISKSIQNGIVVINSITYTPVEYNIRPLILEADAAPYMQLKEFGITSKIVDRFDTIKTTPSGKWDFSLEIHNESAEKFYVLETLNGKDYRALLPWMTSNQNYLVAKFRLTKLFNYKTEPGRVEGYHKVCADIASKHMFLGKSLSLDDFDKRLSDVESGKIQDAIVESLIKTAEKIIEKEYKSKLTNTKDVSDVLHHKLIEEEFTKSVTLQLKNDPTRLDGGVFPTSELMVSFVVSLQISTRRFIREVHNGYSRNPLKPDDFKDAKLVYKKVEDVLRDAVRLVVKLDDNLFTSSYYKYLILNFAT